MFLFYYTLAILFLSTSVATLCFSVYAVSRQQIYLISALGFVCYFFDVSLVFRNDFLVSAAGGSLNTFTATATPIEFTIFGGGLYLCFWLVIATYMGFSNTYAKVIPSIIFVTVSLLVIVLLPEGNLRQFVFFSVRTVFAFCILTYAGIACYRTKDSVERKRYLKHLKLYIFLWVGSVAVLLENIVFLLIFKPALTGVDYISFRPERNIAENIFMIGVSLYVVRDALRILNLYFERTPSKDKNLESSITQNNLDYYSKLYGLTNRENEILHYVLLGRSNQEIADELVLSIATVKVHVHNIFKKTEQKNRHDLLQDFWKNH